jgi:flagellar hook-associated protein 2
MPIKNVDLTKARFLMAGMSVGGLVSGLDTNSIVAQLTALEQMKVTRETQKKESAQKTLDKFKELQTRLGNLALKASALETQNKFNVFKSTSSYEDYVTVSGKEGATAGQYEVVVNKLATTQKVASNKIDDINKPVAPPSAFGAEGTVTIYLSKTEAALKKDPTKPTVEIKISEKDTLKDIVNKINAAEGAGVRASIMAMANGDNRLVLTAVETGTKGFSISEDGGTSLLQTLGILSSDKGQTALSDSALITKKGAATEETTFDELNTSPLLKKVDTTTDKIGLNIGGGWITASLTGTVQDALDELNGQLTNLTVSLNSSGEIVISRNDGSDISSSIASDFQVKIGTFDASNNLTDEKRDLGKFTTQNTFENVITKAENAFYTIDDMAISSRSNSDDKTIDGTVFTLKKVSKEGMESIKVSLDLDKDAIVNNITAFVDEFNALLSFINENAKVTVKEDTDKITGKKTSSREVGPFSGDSGIASLRDTLKRMMTGIVDEISGTKDNGYKTDYSSASRIGITTQKDGTLGIDKDKLLKAISTDFEGVRRLFTSNDFSDTAGCKVGNFTKNSTQGTYRIDVATGKVYLNEEEIDVVSDDILENRIITLKNGLSFEIPTDVSNGDIKITFVRGIASQLSNFVTKAKDNVSSDYITADGKYHANYGYFKASETNYQNRINSIQKRVEELQARVDNYSARISKQFAALEKNIGNLQSQTANMMSALGGISYKR